MAFIDLQTGEMRTLAHNVDCAGVARLSNHEVVVSNGRGGIQIYSCRFGESTRLSGVEYSEIHWDNHMIVV